MLKLSQYNKYKIYLIFAVTTPNSDFSNRVTWTVIIIHLILEEEKTKHGSEKKVGMKAHSFDSLHDWGSVSSPAFPIYKNGHCLQPALTLIPCPNICSHAAASYGWCSHGICYIKKENACPYTLEREN